MKGLINLREQLSLSHQQLAEYLCFSRSVVSMCEQGKRDLPVAALLKLGKLEIEQNRAASKKRQLHNVSTGPAANKHLSGLIRKLTSRMDVCRKKAASLKLDLQRKQKTFQTLSSRLMLLQSQHSDDLSGKKPRLQMKIRLNWINKKMATVNRAVQFYLQHQVKVLVAEAKSHEKAIETLRSGKFP